MSSNLSFLIGPPILEGESFRDVGSFAAFGQDQDAALAEFLYIQQDAAKLLIEGDHLATVIGHAVDEDLQSLVASVGAGRWKGMWLAKIIIDTEKTTTKAGTPLGILLSTDGVYLITAYIQSAMQASWARPTWSFAEAMALEVTDNVIHVDFDHGRRTEA